MGIQRVAGLLAAGVAMLAASLTIPAALTSASATTPICGSMAGTAPHITKVLWIAMENESYGLGPKGIPGSPSAPYIKNTLAAQCGSTSNYHAVTHPSYPNYLAMTSGGTQGVTGDGLTYVTAPSVFSQVDPSWRSYEEFMPVTCDHIFQTGANPPSQYYLGRHNPAASYSALPVGAPKSGDCTTNDVPLGTTTSGPLEHDVTAGSLPKFSLITPGLCDDMHAVPAGDSSCPDLIKGGDNWLSTWIPILTGGPDYASGNLVIDVVWDEGRGGAKGEDCTSSTAVDCIVPNLVISPYTPHVLSATNFSHYSLLKTTEELLGVPLLGHAGDASTTDMCGPFGICPQPGGPPTAAFTSTCSALSCTFAGTSSTAPGSSISDYAWTFGDGATGSTATASHGYAAAGTYPVTLTVTNAQGQMASVTHQVAVSSAPPPAIGFVAATGTTKNAATETVTVPTAVHAGDAMVLAATGATTSALSAPAGWTLVGSTPNPVMTTAVWSKVATAADPGSAVTVTFPAQVKGSVQLAAYSGTSPTAPVAGIAGAVTHVNATQATTPTLNVPASGDWLVSYWTAKSSAVTAWGSPAAAAARNSAIGTGGGQISSLLADSNGPVPSGTAGGLVATADQTFSASTTLSIALAPG
jgi:PKD repeat protein